MEVIKTDVEEFKIGAENERRRDSLKGLVEASKEG